MPEPDDCRAPTTVGPRLPSGGHHRRRKWYANGAVETAGCSASRWKRQVMGLHKVNSTPLPTSLQDTLPALFSGQPEGLSLCSAQESSELAILKCQRIRYGHDNLFAGQAECQETWPASSARSRRRRCRRAMASTVLLDQARKPTCCCQ
jgi:hypothetical protein